MWFFFLFTSSAFPKIYINSCSARLCYQLQQSNTAWNNTSEQDVQQGLCIFSFKASPLSILGERIIFSELCYQPCLSIAPWNFPAASPHIFGYEQNTELSSNITVLLNQWALQVFCFSSTFFPPILSFTGMLGLVHCLSHLHPGGHWVVLHRVDSVSAQYPIFFYKGGRKDCFQDN